MSLLKHSCLLVMGAALGIGLVRPAWGAPPNVLLILVDDLKPALGCYGDPVARTPAMDRLAASALRWTRAYANQAVCAPSRYNLLTGMRSTTSGLYSLSGSLRSRWPQAVTLPQYFARHGYETHSLGKVFHVGHGNPGDDGSFTVSPLHDKVVEYAVFQSPQGTLTREEALFQNQSAVVRGRPLPRGPAWEAHELPDDAYADGRIAAEAIRRLEAWKASPKHPLFLAVGFVRPHLPFCVPKKYWDLYEPSRLPMPEVTAPPRGAPPVALKRGGEIAQYEPVPESGEVDEALTRSLIHGYYASVSYVDAQIGRVLDALDRLGLADNTLVVLWGDHGFHLGDHGLWTKHTNYEQATHIPLMIRAPGVTRPGSRCEAVVETVDLYPTLAELAGLPAPDVPQPIDGESLVPLMRQPDLAREDHAYHAFPRGRYLGRAIRTARYRLVVWTPRDEGGGPVHLELYDYQVDPLETRNLAETQPDVVATLRQILDRHPPPQPWP
jgi:iduronate 2-sulfatase